MRLGLKPRSPDSIRSFTRRHPSSAWSVPKSPPAPPTRPGSEARSTVHCVPEHCAGLRESHRTELGHRATKCTPWKGVDVVKVDNTLRRDSIVLWCQLEFGNESSLGSGQRRHDHRPDSIRCRITRQHQDGPVTAWCLGEPDFTPLHHSQSDQSSAGPQSATSARLDSAADIGLRIQDSISDSARSLTR